MDRTRFKATEAEGELDDWSETRLSCTLLIKRTARKGRYTVLPIGANVVETELFLFEARDKNILAIYITQNMVPLIRYALLS